MINPLSLSNFERRKYTTQQKYYFFISAKIMYTIIGFYAILLARHITKGGRHENRPGLGCKISRRHVDSHFRLWSVIVILQRSCCAQKDPNGGIGRTQRLNDRAGLSTFQLQDPKILLRYPTLGSGKQHRSLVTQKDWSQKRTQANIAAGKTRYSTAPDHRQEHVRNDTDPQPTRLCSQIAAGGSNIKRLWHQQKKIASKQVKERSRALLTPETIEILNHALKPKSIEITRQSIQTDLETLLKRGFTSTHAGGFFFTPYLMQLDLYKNLSTLSAHKTTGIPNEKLALQMIWEPLFGYRKGIRKVDPVSQTDFGALSGLPFICSASTEYRFLSESTIEGAENFQKSLGKRLKQLGYINGDVINMDGHSIKLFSRKEMKASYLSKDKTYGKAIRTFYTQDQSSKKPLFAKVAYSGANVAQVTPQLVEANKEILGGAFLSVNDKEWFIGSLLEQLDKIHGIQVLLPVKRTPKRLREMKAIPFDQFKYRYHNQPVAKLVTDLDGFTGQMKMFVKRNSDNTFFALITNKKYYRAATALQHYKKRWRIENFFNENVFLGIDQLPSLELNAIQASLTLKMVSFHLVDNFRKNLPEPFNSMKPESIYQNFIQGVQGKVQIKKDKLQVDIYGFKHRDAIVPFLKNLEQKLIAQNVDPRCSWLNQYPLKFSFK